MAQRLNARRLETTAPAPDVPPSLAAIFARLRAHFGPLTGPGAARPWWPVFGTDAPFEMLVGAVLVQQTRWETVEGAILRLLAAGLLGPQAMASAATETIAALIRPAAFYGQKATGLITIARHIVAGYGGDTARMLARPTAEVRAELLRLPRIGPETCDVILLYAGGHPVFVIDAYTRRLFERVAPALGPGAGDGPMPAPPPWHRPYESLRRTIEMELRQDDPAALYAEYHAQINEVCVRYCLTRPRCNGPPARRVYSRQEGRESYLGRHDGCPLRPVCAWYRQSQ
ncbi:MAG: Fe-S cluster assembly protein HesB [Chloroflexaceae bacterium]|nr:Fe-S cluster assembly protein HesB [Chloroflexaceae bacterium]